MYGGYRDYSVQFLQRTMTRDYCDYSMCGERKKKIVYNRGVEQRVQSGARVKY